MHKRRILLFGEGVSQAHVGRALSLARMLDPARYELHFASAEASRYLAGAAGLKFHAVPTLPPAEFLRRLARGAPVCDAETLRASVEGDLRLISGVKPDLIVGDFRISLGISAAVAGVRYASCINAYWSPYTLLPMPVPDLFLARLAGVALSTWIAGHVSGTVLRSHARGFNRVRKAYGLPPVADFREMLSQGDWTCYLDHPDLTPVGALSASHRFLGPVTWAPFAALPAGWVEWRNRMPLVYLTLGSSGDTRVLDTLLAALGRLPVQVALATAGRASHEATTEKLFARAFLPGDLMLCHAAVCISNGGAGTGYQALAAGKPVLAVPSNVDQCYHTQTVLRAGAGLALRPGGLSLRAVTQAVEALLAGGTYERQAGVWAKKLRVWSTAERFQTLVSEALQDDAASRTQDAALRAMQPIACVP